MRQKPVIPYGASSWMRICLCLVLVTVACSQAPSAQEAQAAITVFLQEGKQLRDPAYQLKSATVKGVEIQRIGRFDTQRQSWPVQAKIQGTYQLSTGQIALQEQFDRVEQFDLYLTQEGKWQVVLKNENR